MDKREENTQVTYIKPTTEVIKLEIEGVIAGSMSGAGIVDMGESTASFFY